jgi:hypothetical protein
LYMLPSASRERWRVEDGAVDRVLVKIVYLIDPNLLGLVTGPAIEGAKIERPRPVVPGERIVTTRI